MNIPVDANGGEVLSVPQFACPDCKYVISGRYESIESGIVEGGCDCGRLWFIPLEKREAYYLDNLQQKNQQKNQQKSDQS